MLYRFKKLFLFVFLLITNLLFSDELLERREAYILTKSSWQEVKAQEKKAFLESKKEKRKIKKEVSRRIHTAEKISTRSVSPNGDIFVNRLYDFSLSNESKGKILIQIDDQPEQEYSPNLVLLREGLHTISYKFFDESGILKNQKKEVVFLDVTAPEVIAQLQGIYFERNSFYYYKPGVKLFLQAKDNESGLADIFLNQNKKGYLPLDKIDQPIDSPGPKEIKILAIDRVTNLSQEIYLRFTVDAEPPVVDIELDSIPELTASKGLLCERDAMIRLSAFDLGAGVAKIEFRKHGQKEWRTYRDYPLVSRKKKKISLEFRAIDNLGNESQIKHFKCKVKDEATSISEQ